MASVMNYEQVKAQVLQLSAAERNRLLAELETTEAEPDFALEPPPLSPPPVVVRQGEARDYAPEHQWLREHSHEYPGQTLALAGDELLAHGIDPKEVMAQAKATGRRFLLHRVPEEGEIWGGCFE